MMQRCLLLGKKQYSSSLVCINEDLDTNTAKKKKFPIYLSI